MEITTCAVVLKSFKLFFVLFFCFVFVSPFQNITPLEEMRMAGPACFPSITKITGTQIAQMLTTQNSVIGVQLKHISTMNSGATAQQVVSTVYEN